MASDLDSFLLSRSISRGRNRHVNCILNQKQHSSSPSYFEAHYFLSLKCFNSFPIGTAVKTLKMTHDKSPFIQSTISLLDYYRSSHRFPVIQPKDDSSEIRQFTTINAVNSIALDPINNDYLLTGSNNGKIQVFTTANAELAANISSSIGSTHDAFNNNEGLNGHSFAISIVKWWPFDTGMFLSGSYDKSIKIWDTESLQVIHTIQNDKIIPRDSDLEMLESFNANISNSFESRFGHIYSMAFSPVLQHGLLAIGSQGADYLKLYDIRTMSPASYLFEAKAKNNLFRGNGSSKAFSKEVGSMVSVAWNPTSENIICSGSSTGMIKVWDIRKNSSFLYSLDSGFLEKQKNDVSKKRSLMSNSSQNIDICHTSAVNGICWNGPSMLVSVGMDNIIKYWNLKDKNYSVILNGNSTKVSKKKRKLFNKLNKVEQHTPSVIFSNSVMRNVNPIMIGPPSYIEDSTEYSAGNSSTSYMNYFTNNSFFTYKLSKNDVSDNSFFKYYQTDGEASARYTSMDLTPKQSPKIRYYFGTTEGSIDTWGPINDDIIDPQLYIS